MKQSLIATMTILLFGCSSSVPYDTNAESARPESTVSVNTVDTKDVKDTMDAKNTKAAMTVPMGFIKANGIARTEHRDLPAYTSLIIEGPFEVNVDEKTEPMVSVMADENLIAHVITEVEGNMLKIYSPTGFETNGTLKIEIHNGNLEKIVATDRANVDVDNLDAPRFEVSASDETHMNLSGKANEFEAYLSDHAHLKASHLQAKTAKVVQMGNSHAEVYARESLDLNVTDAAKLFYYGNPVVVNKTVTGTAQLNQR